MNIIGELFKWIWATFFWLKHHILHLILKAEKHHYETEVWEEGVERAMGRPRSKPGVKPRAKPP